MKILILPDLHARKFWRQAITDNANKVDKVIFLGDYLDPYNNEIYNNPETMECKSFDDLENNLQMLNDIISLKKNEPDKYILLTGNHTDSYIWPTFSAATRTDYKNWETYHKFFTDNLDLFNLVWIEDNVIFSHAGITEKWAQRVWNELEFPNDELSSVMEVAIMFKDSPLKDFNKSYIDVISDISYYRGGSFPFGSCEWADLREHVDVTSIAKLIPLGEDGIFQVFGHTQLKNTLITDKWACLDCRKGFIVNTNTYEIKEC